MPRIADRPRRTASRSLLTDPRASGRGRKGGALVEFAVVFPVFLVLVVGAIDVGRAVMVRQTLAEAARAGARLLCVRKEVTEAQVNAVIDKVMNPFFSTKTEGKRTGLGLSISHGILEEHGGRLNVNSKEGRFTNVMIELPGYVQSEP